MRAFVANLVLAMTWVGMTGSFRLANLALGFVLGYLVLWATPLLSSRTSYFRKVVQVGEFVAFFARELVVSAVRIAVEAVTPGQRARPGIVRVPLEPASDGAITLLANLVTLTPGSLTLDVAPDRGALFVHVLFVDDPDAVRREIKAGFERRVLEVLR